MNLLARAACRTRTATPIWGMVAVTPDADKDRTEPVPGTLGGLLYANPDRVRVQEREWVGLLQAVARRDQAALNTLYARLHRIVFTSIVRIVKTREMAEELTVDVFYDLWRRADRYDPAGGTVVGWIMNQARSRAIDRLRFEQRKKRTNPYPETESAETLTPGSEELIAAQAQAHLLKEALVTLTSGEREAIETAYFSEYTYAEAAKRLNLPPGTVKTRIRSALVKLRQAMASRGDES